MKPLLPALLLAVLVPCVSMADEPKAEATTLTPAELQQLFGITALRFEVPESFGDYFSLRVEVYREGKRTITLGGGRRVPNDRRVAVAIQDTDSGFVVTALSSDGAQPIEIPKMYFDGLTGRGTYAEESSSSKATDGRTILFQKIFYRAKLEADGLSFSTDNPENEKTGKCVVFIERRKTQKSESGRNGD